MGHGNACMSIIVNGILKGDSYLWQLQISELT